VTFALEFINKQGLGLLITMVESGKNKGAILAYSLSSFVELMDHGIVSWDILEVPFINKVASYVNNQSQPQEAKVTIFGNQFWVGRCFLLTKLFTYSGNPSIPSNELKHRMPQGSHLVIPLSHDGTQVPLYGCSHFRLLSIC